GAKGRAGAAGSAEESGQGFLGVALLWGSGAGKDGHEGEVHAPRADRGHPAARVQGGPPACGVHAGGDGGRSGSGAGDSAGGRQGQGSRRCDGGERGAPADPGAPEERIMTPGNNCFKTSVEG